MKAAWTELKTAGRAVLALAVLLCAAYPLATWLLAQGAFPRRANGSLITGRGVVRGSSLIARGFSGPGYFHPRPSAAGQGYDAFRSGGSNLGPLAKDLVETVRVRVAAYRAENGLPDGTPVPVDAVTASGSGLDPDISPANARLQAPRVARARGTAEAEVLRLVEASIRGRTLGILGEPRINVLLLNLALEELRHAE